MFIYDLYTGYIIGTCIKFLGFILAVCLILHETYPGRFSAQYHIYRTYLPLYNKLEAEYDAKYPAIIPRSTCLNLGISPLDSLKLVFFVRDSSFIIMRIKDYSIVAEIPFASIIYSESYVDIMSKHDYLSIINLHFNTPTQDDCVIGFCTIEYFKRLNKKYNDRLDGRSLVKFINDNFPTEEQYEKNHH